MQRKKDGIGRFIVELLYGTFIAFSSLLKKGMFLNVFEGIIAATTKNA